MKRKTRRMQAQEKWNTVEAPIDKDKIATVLAKYPHMHPWSVENVGRIESTKKVDEVQT